MGADVNVRELTKDEIAAIPKVQTPVPESMFAMGVENEKGEIVASVPVYLAIHAAPLWVREDYRNHPRALLRLWQETRKKIMEYGGTQVTVCFTPDDPGPPLENVLLKIYEFVGARELNARFFSISMDGSDV